jgi:hypothetical protein
VLSSSDQDPQRGPGAVIAAWAAKLGGLQGQDRSGDTPGIKGVGLAGTPVVASVHPCRLDHLIAGVAHRRCQAGTVGGDTLDDPQCGQVTGGAARRPRDGPIHPRPSGREPFGGYRFAGGGDQDGDGVATGVGVHADDERVGMREDGHGEWASFQTQRTGIRPPKRAGAGLDGSHFGAAL